MKKFVCGHCGGRIAVTPRHLQKLVVCPECGRATHPLATEILAAAAKPDSIESRTKQTLSDKAVGRHCENCGRSIGRLEKLQLWDNHLVCKDCYGRLAETTEAAVALLQSSSAVPLEPLAPTREAVRRPRKKLLPWGKGSAAIATSVSAEPTALVKAVPVTPPADPRTVSLLAASSADALRVSVARVASAASALPPLSLKQRIAVLLCVIGFGGVALYGALTLLRDLAGLITTIALILLVVAATVFLLKTGWTHISYWWSRLGGAKAQEESKP